MSAEEELPWGGSRLITGTGAYGPLPIMAEVVEEAGRRGVDLAAIPTEDACQLIAGLDEREVYAVFMSRAEGAALHARAAGRAILPMSGTGHASHLGQAPARRVAS